MTTSASRIAQRVHPPPCVFESRRIQQRDGRWVFVDLVAKEIALREGKVALVMAGEREVFAHASRLIEELDYSGETAFDIERRTKRKVEELTEGN